MTELAVTAGDFALSGGDARLEKITPLWPDPYQASSSLGDVLYVVVKRTVGGNAVRYIERMHSRDIGT